MKLIQVLTSQPQKELVERANILGLTCNANSRQQLTEELSKALLNKDIVRTKWNQLEGPHRHLLLQMSYGQSLGGYSTELLTGLKRADRHLFPTVINTLKQHGWVYEDENNYWILPLELQKWIQEFTYEEWGLDFIFIPRVNEPSYDAIYDLFEFMDFVSTTKIPLTKNKTIYKKQLTTILKSLSKNESVPFEKWRFGYGRHFNSYPDCFSFLYDFCYEQGWILEENELSVSNKWEHGQETSVNELLDRMIRQYIRIYRRAIPQLPFIVDMITKLLANGDGMEKKQMVNRIKNFVDPYYYDNPKDVVGKRIINMLEYIHFLSSYKLDNESFIYLNSRMLKKY